MALLKRKELRHLSELGNMPVFRAGNSSIRAKFSYTQSWDANSGTFWASPIITAQYNVHQGAYVTFTASHGRTTLLNIVNGSGVLTHVLSPVIFNDGYSRQPLVFIITVDGFEYYQLVAKAEANMRIMLGGFKVGNPQQSTGQDPLVDGGYYDQGFLNGEQSHTMLTPRQAELMGLGIVYKKSLKVEIVIGDYANAITYGSRAGVMYVPK